MNSTSTVLWEVPPARGAPTRCHSATESVFWNLRGAGLLRSLQWGNGYVIAPNDMEVHTDPNEVGWGQPGEGTEPGDWVEGIDPVGEIEPVSLFEDQLARRLGVGQ